MSPVGVVPSVDLALVGEWKQVEAEMIVGRNKRVEGPPHFTKIADVDALIDVESRDCLDSHLKNDPDGADAADHRPEQIVRRLAHN